MTTLRQAQTALLIQPPEPQPPLSKEEVGEVENVEVLEISGNIFTARIKYRWVTREYTFHTRIDCAIATVERIGPTYRVVSFE